MTGTGTKADPFRPTNWDEFVTAVAKYNSYVECPENAVWDMNDAAAQGIDNPISVYANEVKGNGLTIKNLRHNGILLRKDTDTTTRNVYDLYFENLIGKNRVVSADFRNSGYLNLYGCVFNGVNTSNEILIVSYYNSSMTSGNILFGTSKYSGKGCGITIEAPNATLFRGVYYYGNNISLTDTNIYFKGKHFNLVGSQYEVRLNNCLISGEFDDISNINGNHNVINARTNSLTSNRGLSLTVLNKDKCPSYPSSVFAVTEEQLKDADYLRSLGFPIGV